MEKTVFLRIASSSEVLQIHHTTLLSEEPLQIIFNECQSFRLMTAPLDNIS